MKAKRKMDEIISVIIWRDQAKRIENKFGLHMVGDTKDIDTKVHFEKVSAEGRSKILITIYLEPLGITLRFPRR